MLSTRPSSCCSKPLKVTVKSITVVLAESSGLKWGFGRREVMYKQNLRAKAKVLRPEMLRSRLRGLGVIPVFYRGHFFGGRLSMNKSIYTTPNIEKRQVLLSKA